MSTLFHFSPDPRIPYQEIVERIRRISWGTSRQLGFISRYPFLLWRHSSPNIEREVVLSAGIHGNEPSGVESILTLLEQRPHWLNRSNLTVFPCLNPWGYEHNVRVNELGLDINRQWKETKIKEVMLTRSVLQKKRFHLTIGLHEDYDATGFYIYELSRSKPLYGPAIARSVSRIIPIEKRNRIEGRISDQGVISRSIQSIRRRKYWPEALYHIMNHCDRTLTTETPTHFPIHKRVQAQIEAIRVAISLLK